MAGSPEFLQPPLFWQQHTSKLPISYVQTLPSSLYRKGSGTVCWIVAETVPNQSVDKQTVLLSAMSPLLRRILYIMTSTKISNLLMQPVSWTSLTLLCSFQSPNFTSCSGTTSCFPSLAVVAVSPSLLLVCDLFVLLVRHELQLTTERFSSSRSLKDIFVISKQECNMPFHKHYSG